MDEAIGLLREESRRVLVDAEAIDDRSSGFQRKTGRRGDVSERIPVAIAGNSMKAIALSANMEGLRPRGIAA